MVDGLIFGHVICRCSLASACTPPAGVSSVNTSDAGRPAGDLAIKLSRTRGGGVSSPLEARPLTRTLRPAKSMRSGADTDSCRPCERKEPGAISGARRTGAAPPASPPVDEPSLL